jgi:hypothetical protein
MPPVGFEPTIPVIERVKTVYALDLEATVIGIALISGKEIYEAPHCCILQPPVASSLSNVIHQAMKLKISTY